MLLTLQAPAFMTRLFTGAARPRVTRWFAHRVRQGSTYPVTPPEGKVTLHCRQGEAWVTQDGDIADLVLRARESRKLTSREVMYFHAFDGDCVFEFQVEE